MLSQFHFGHTQTPWQYGSANTRIVTSQPKLKIAGGVTLSLTLLAILAAWLLLDPAATPRVELDNAKAHGKRGGVICNMLRERDIQRLPNKLTVKGHLIKRGTPLTALPAGLIAEGNLTLHKTRIRRLPSDLTVRDDLDTYAGFGAPVIRCNDIPATVIVKGKRVRAN
jgi:hypothetical protein